MYKRDDSSKFVSEPTSIDDIRAAAILAFRLCGPLKSFVPSVGKASFFSSNETDRGIFDIFNGLLALGTLPGSFFIVSFLEFGELKKGPSIESLEEKSDLEFKENCCSPLLETQSLVSFEILIFSISLELDCNLFFEDVKLSSSEEESNKLNNVSSSVSSSSDEKKLLNFFLGNNSFLVTILSDTLELNSSIFSLFNLPLTLFSSMGGFDTCFISFDLFNTSTCIGVELRTDICFDLLLNKSSSDEESKSFEDLSSVVEWKTNSFVFSFESINSSSESDSENIFFDEILSLVKLSLESKISCFKVGETVTVFLSDRFFNGLVSFIKSLCTTVTEFGFELSTVLFEILKSFLISSALSFCVVTAIFLLISGIVDGLYL
ncbi:hypothetical protein AGLY_012606 [Aphis glycines]|uniref:Uncharacterized protein n=1 Tax=Aphis glycines TaxID=307491 RepID=A0A6G0T8U4_APHGL|nr:hypothetical protein AGLY_012606 [Aphis glycines]